MSNKLYFCLQNLHGLPDPEPSGVTWMVFPEKFLARSVDYMHQQTSYMK